MQLRKEENKDTTYYHKPTLKKWELTLKSFFVFFMLFYIKIVIIDFLFLDLQFKGEQNITSSTVILIVLLSCVSLITKNYNKN